MGHSDMMRILMIYSAPHFFALFIADLGAQKIIIHSVVVFSLEASNRKG